ncbi:DNA alkylation repair protein [Weissella diestrammenae]|uniref:DNA alkylation repair protein n=1 Tax=Weissella diestrammenae TaxID=1162633 RepID=A0A7G9T4L5_9LACO|nr:DNA alkylation repair protein [Weissella diestrammenae]MCM0582066.1 DNA alkylation repair protein [Weissella diestrammenae]QNN75040.1 DNA alkylation repair protein [Weissella diestrammenae]
MNKLVLPTHPENIIPMENYMKGNFRFLGVKTPERRTLSKPLLKASRSWSEALILEQVNGYWQRPEREYQLIAMDILVHNYRRLGAQTLDEISQFVDDHPWWDSIDTLRKIIGLILRHQPEIWAYWSQYYLTHDSFWGRRIAITLQLQFKEKTDLVYLSTAIENDIQTDEFFIQKAIGWALREYAKTDAQWVTTFIAQHPLLSNLAVREATKNLSH